MLKFNKLNKYAIYNIMRYIFLVALILTFAFTVLMHGVDTGEGEINTLGFIFYFVMVPLDETWVEMYLWIGTVISFLNYILMWRFYPSDQYKDDHYNIFLKIINVFAVLSVPMLWDFFTSIWTFGEIRPVYCILKDISILRTKEVFFIFLTIPALIPALATGVMSVMGILHKPQKKKDEQAITDLKVNLEG